MQQPVTGPVRVNKLQPKQPRGLVVVITGNGKGKTTSAMGMVLRACGHGLRSCVVQFMKGDLYSGEWDGVRLLGDLVELHATGKGFCGLGGNPYSREEHRANAQAAIALAREKMLSGRFDLVILDEINNALKHRLVDLDQLLELLAARPAPLHLILTGRNAAPEVVEPQPGIDY